MTRAARICEYVGSKRSPIFFLQTHFQHNLSSMDRVNKRGSKVGCFYCCQLHPDWQETEAHRFRKISAIRYLTPGSQLALTLEKKFIHSFFCSDLFKAMLSLKPRKALR